MVAIFARLVRLLTIVVAIAVAVVVAALLAAALPMLIGMQSYVVRSGSMEPTIPTGAVVVARRVAPASLKQGDIISFQSAAQPGVTITHRIVKVSGQGAALHINTKGDANAAQDVGYVDTSKPVAKVLYWVPWVGYVIVDLSLSQIGVRLLLVGVGLLLLWARLMVGTRPDRPSTGVAGQPSAPEQKAGR